jgi:hypothetical protein
MLLPISMLCMFLSVGLHNTDTFVDIAPDQPASGAADGHVFGDVFIHIDAYDQYSTAAHG